MVEIFEKILAALIILALVSLLMVVAFPDFNPEAIFRNVPEKTSQNTPQKQQPKQTPVAHQQRVVEQPRATEQPVEQSPTARHATSETRENREVARRMESRTETRHTRSAALEEQRNARRQEARYVEPSVPEERYFDRRDREVRQPPSNRYEAQYNERYQQPCHQFGGCVEAAPATPQYVACDRGEGMCPPLRKPCRPHYVQTDPCEACEKRPYWADNSYRAAYGYVIQDAYAFGVECSYE